MAEKTSFTKSLFVGLWNVVNFSRRFVFNLIFVFVLVAVIISAFSGDDDASTVPASSALVLNMKGNLVIQKQFVDPTQAFFQQMAGQSPDSPEVLVRDVVKVINNAKEDDRIKAIVLDLQGFGGGAIDKLKMVGDALADFKTSGKPIYAMADSYARNQYYLAAYADNLYLHPMGGMLIEGFTRYGNYFKQGLDNVKATTHVFKVGKYKSAVEPYLRNDMSPEAKEANVAWLNELWKQYREQVAAIREFSIDNFDETFESLITKLEAADGDMAKYALDNGWVDGLRTRDEFRQELISLVGENEKGNSYSNVSFYKYLNIISPKVPLPDTDDDKIAIVVAKGTILDGDQKPGAIGGDSTARLLRKAREDDTVKAVVLQVDSGGGSAFASEVIRNEVLLLKEAGKPVVASMASVAASGGYWISASADHIIAEPSTITGSIGIFGMFNTFENALNYVGVYADGVSTNELNGIAIDRPLADGYKQMIQLNIEQGYDQFISLVAKERGMTKEEVHEVAQGRVWVGTQALELGLVDELGDIESAIAKAAELASLENVKTKYIERSLTKEEELVQKIFKAKTEYFGDAKFGITLSPLMQKAFEFDKQVAEFSRLNDPRASYVLCTECNYQ